MYYFRTHCGERMSVYDNCQTALSTLDLYCTSGLIARILTDKLLTQSRNSAKSHDWTILALHLQFVHNNFLLYIMCIEWTRLAFCIIDGWWLWAMSIDEIKPPCSEDIPGLYASFLKGQGHQGIFSLAKGTLWGNCKLLLEHFKGTKAMTRGNWGNQFKFFLMSLKRV